MYREHQPDRADPTVGACIEAFWSFTSVGKPHRVLPDGCMDLLFELGTARLRIVGAMTRAEVVCVPQGESVFGVRFRPGRAALFLRSGAHELADQDVADRLLGDDGARLADAVARASSDAGRVRSASAFLARPEVRVRSVDARITRAVELLQRSRGALPITQVASACRICDRQLERLFRERVGLRPKVFARILRMQHAVGCARLTTRQSDVASMAGYADEAHLVREFQSLSGVTLPQLLRERDVGFFQSRDATETPV